MTRLTQAQIDAFLNAKEAELLDPGNRAPIHFGREYARSLPESGGTYVFFFHDEVFYVGETTSLRQRLAVHMRNPENHVLILKIARLLYDEINGPGLAGSRRKFDESHKARSRRWVERHLRVALVDLGIGRKELEERLVQKHSPPFNERYPSLP